MKTHRIYGKPSPKANDRKISFGRRCDCGRLASYILMKEAVCERCYNIHTSGVVYEMTKANEKQRKQIVNEEFYVCNL
jgi:hypothetical protein